MSLAKIDKLCDDKECANFPHKMFDNTYHVPCGNCGQQRPYNEVRDWQTQDELGKMCDPCLTAQYGDDISGI